MSYYVGNMPVGEHLEHHGIKGMRWGQRRYQNRDGSLTSAGRVRYAVGTGRRNLRRAAGNARNSTQGWYRRNKKTIGRVARIAGTAAAVAGTAYLGKRYGKSAVKAARRLGGKAFPAGTKRAQMLTGARYKAGMARMNARNKVNNFIRDTSRQHYMNKATRRDVRQAKQFERMLNPNSTKRTSSLSKTAKRLSGKAFPAGTKRAQVLSKVKYKGSMVKMNARNKVNNIVNDTSRQHYMNKAAKRDARQAKQFERMFDNKDKQTAKTLARNSAKSRKVQRSELNEIRRNDASRNRIMKKVEKRDARQAKKFEQSFKKRNAQQAKANARKTNLKTRYENEAKVSQTVFGRRPTYNEWLSARAETSAYRRKNVKRAAAAGAVAGGVGGAVGSYYGLKRSRKKTKKR